MPEKRVLPLNNPFSQKRPTVDLPVDPGVGKGGYGVRQGEKGDRPTIYMLIRCRQCNKEQQVVFYYWYPPKMHTCTGCKEKQPTQGYVVIAHANFPLG